MGINNYAHLLAACSTRGISALGQQSENRSASSAGTHSLYNSTGPNQTRKSVEEEGEDYLNQRGFSKRNTVVIYSLF